MYHIFTPLSRWISVIGYLDLKAQYGWRRLIKAVSLLPNPIMFIHHKILFKFNYGRNQVSSFKYLGVTCSKNGSFNFNIKL
jgi:hypothetical protein